jgi:hypothetical protein
MGAITVAERNKYLRGWFTAQLVKLGINPLRAVEIAAEIPSQLILEAYEDVRKRIARSQPML